MTALVTATVLSLAFLAALGAIVLGFLVYALSSVNDRPRRLVGLLVISASIAFAISDIYMLTRINN